MTDTNMAATGHTAARLRMRSASGTGGTTGPDPGLSRTLRAIAIE